MVKITDDKLNPGATSLLKKCTHKHNYIVQCALKLTLSCSLWTFPCPLGKGTPESCWCHPSQRPSAHGSVTHGTQWHRTYWHSNPEGIKREQVSPVKLLHPGTTENIIKHAPQAQRSLLAVNDTATKPERACPPFYGFIIILLLCIRRPLCVAGRFWCGSLWK